MAAECEGGWRMQLGQTSAYAMQNGGWYLESCAVSASDIGTVRILEPGESYVSPGVLSGRVAGGMDEAVCALTMARRILYKKEESPLMFNDYMNCLWSNVTEEAICKLATKASEFGAEGYCIDCGWFYPLNDMYGRLGDWVWNEERFPKKKLKGTIEFIRNKGLIPGVWTELEVCSNNAAAFSLPDEYFICVHGNRVGGGERFFFDMRNNAVREYLVKKVEALYNIGIRYIKNDFNAALRWCSHSDLIAENHRAAMEFYSDLKKKFPDLYLENCGSGAMRCDYGTLKHFCVQSVSDQELYYLNPPIIQGMFANILPEQAGIWAYPYPNLFDVRADLAAMEAEAARQDDGRQTIFNLVNGIAGNMYLSGRIDYADHKNSELIREGIRFFRQIRPFKRESSAVFPNGFADISSEGEFTTLGLLNYAKTKMYLFFWRFNGKEERFVVPLAKWFKNGTVARRVYPKDIGCVAGELSGKNLVITAKEPNSAAIFEVEFGGMV